MTAAAITPGLASVARARHARGSHALPCAGVPWAASVSGKRTGRTAFLKVIDISSYSCGPFRPVRAPDKVESAVRAVRLPECDGPQGFVAHGRECGTVRLAAAACDVGGAGKTDFAAVGRWPRRQLHRRQVTPRRAKRVAIGSWPWLLSPPTTSKAI